MIYYRCQCGSMTGAYSGMQPADCRGCDKCGTNLEREPIQPHDFVSKTIPDADQPGATVTRCRKCLRTKQQIEREAARDAQAPKP